MNTQGTCTIPGANRTGVPLPTKPVSRPEDDIVARLERAHARPSSSPFTADAPEFTREQLLAAGFTVGAERKPKKTRADVSAKHLEIARLYVDENLTTGQIAEQYGITISGVQYALDRAGVQRDPNRKTQRRGVVVPVETLRRLHVDELLTCAQIGERYGLSESAISRRLREAGITRPRVERPKRDPGRPRRTDLDRPKIVADYLASQSSKVVADNHGCSPHTVLTIVREAGHTPRGSIIGRPRNITLNKDALTELYVTQGLSCAAVAVELGVSATTVRRNLKAHGVPRRDDRGELITTLARELADTLRANGLTMHDVRIWARKKGHAVASHGSVGRELIEAYLLENTHRTQKEISA